MFHLTTSSSTTVLRVLETGHLELEWFASPVPQSEPRLRFPERDQGVPGMVVNYGPTAQSAWSPGEATLAWSSLGKGDYRTPGIRIADNAVLDFTYRDHRVLPGTLLQPELPQAEGEAASQTLEITLRDDVAGLECRLYFTIFPDSGVLTRRTVVRNVGTETQVLTHVASFLADLQAPRAEVITLDGRWLGEASLNRSPVTGPQIVNASLTGSSSTEHNPGFALADPETTESAGWCYGFNLIYSGSHKSTVERCAAGTIRVVGGLHPDDFAWELEVGAEFVTPEAVLCFSAQGLGDLSERLHRFVNACVVPPAWRERSRPVVLNSWEAVYFDFDADRLLEVAAAGASLGAEVFVIDDGWFGNRSDDRRALGDWQVNEEKLPGGLARLSDQLRELDLKLGLWFEPEAVSPDSELYRRHPDWAISAPGRVPSEGRFELLLDLTKTEVRDHLVGAVGAILDSVDVAFVKWDMNRLISDSAPAGFNYRYLLGLYDVLGRIFGPRPEILLETCSSGGNRFDLGMLSFGAQIWASDCTDPIERMSIQDGLSLLYPSSTISAHVSASPNHQTRRSAPLGFRFGVSATCNLGLELDPRLLTQQERDELGAAIDWYKANRRVLQFGDRRRLPSCPGTQNIVFSSAGEVLVARLEGTVAPRLPRWPFVVPVADGNYRVTQELSPTSSSLELPGAALRFGVPQPGPAVGLSAELFRVERQRPAESARS